MKNSFFSRAGNNLRFLHDTVLSFCTLEILKIMNSFNDDFKTAIHLEKLLWASSRTPDAGRVIDLIRGHTITARALDWESRDQGPEIGFL